MNPLFSSEEYTESLVPGTWHPLKDSTNSFTMLFHCSWKQAKCPVAALALQVSFFLFAKGYKGTKSVRL